MTMRFPKLLFSPAPSAGNGAAPVALAAAPVAAAPAVPAEPTTLADFAEAARRSMAEEHPANQPSAAATPDAAVAPEPGLESPPDPNAPPAPADPAAPDPAIADPDPAEEPDAPTADEQALWTDGERRLYGALKKERQESKTARAETRDLKSKLEAIEARLANPPAVAAPANGQPAPDPAVQPAAATPSVSHGSLSDCTSFEAVDARVTQAAATEAMAVRLQNQLTRNGVEGVAAALKQQGITQIGGVPVAELDANAVGQFLDSVYEGTRATQAAAAPRKQFIATMDRQWQAAAQIMPEINDIKSAAHRNVQQLLQTNPSLRANANWPMVAVKLMLGEAAVAAKVKPAAPAPAVPPPTVKVVVKPAPGAPRRTSAALPQGNAMDAIKARIDNGTATMADVQAYARTDVTIR